MLFITYWELNENMPEPERLRIAEQMTSSGLFPPAGITLLRWDGTPDGWGVLIMEAERAEDVHRALELWRAAGAGFFKATRTAPALPIQQLLPVASEALKAVGAR